MKKNHRVTLLSSLGAGFEYYDFIIYGMLASYLVPLFFVEDAPLTGLLKVFSIFALGYVVRPFGGLFFGMIADRFGRKSTFVMVMLLMGVSTFSIGILPTTHQIGPIAAVLLALFRIMQGVSFGAELPGAIIVVSEFNNKDKRGTHCGFVISSTGLGAALASFILMLLTTFLSTQDIGQWGWRIPFIFGGILAIISYFIRLRFRETPEFEAISSHQRKISFFAPLRELIQHYFRELFLGISIIFATSTLIITNIYIPSYLKSFFHYSSGEVFQAMTISLLWSALILPFLGWLTDRWERSNFLKTIFLLFVIGGYFEFKLLEYNTFPALLAFFMIFQTFISASIVSTLPLMVELFPTQIRFTAIGGCYNIAYTLSALVPILLTYLLDVFNDSFIVFYVLAVIISFSFAALVLGRKIIGQSQNLINQGQRGSLKAA